MRSIAVLIFLSISTVHLLDAYAVDEDVEFLPSYDEQQQHGQLQLADKRPFSMTYGTRYRGRKGKRPFVLSYGRPRYNGYAKRPYNARLNMEHAKNFHQIPHQTLKDFNEMIDNRAYGLHKRPFVFSYGRR